MLLKKVKVSAKNRRIKNRQPADVLLILSSELREKIDLSHSPWLLILRGFISFQGLIDD